MTQFN